MVLFASSNSGPAQFSGLKMPAENNPYLWDSAANRRDGNVLNRL
jgi:hypothetical protein